MSKRVPIVHVTYREGMSSVFLSQVARPMSLVMQQGYPVSLAVFAPVGEYIRPSSRRPWFERREAIAHEFGLQVYSFPSPPARARRLWREAPLLRHWLKRRFRSDQRVILHCRGPQATDLALRSVEGDSRFRVVFDCRGINGVEFLYVNGYRDAGDAPDALRKQAESIEALERRVVRDSHAMICVSAAMKRYVVAEWSASPNKVQVVPCCADADAGERAAAQREAMRQRLGFEGKFVVAYCGSLAPWQMPMESLAAFQQVARLRPNAHFFGITTQPSRLEELADRSGVKANQRTILSLAHSEVPVYLAAADVGLLIRELSLVNRVASPVKFAEYLSCGVPVIISEGVGDYTGLVRENKIGCVLTSLNSDEQKESPSLPAAFDQFELTNVVRGRCRSVAENELGWKAFIAKVNLLYGALHAST